VATAVRRRESKVQTLGIPHHHISEQGVVKQEEAPECALRQRVYRVVILLMAGAPSLPSQRCAPRRGAWVKHLSPLDTPLSQQKLAQTTSQAACCCAERAAPSSLMLISRRRQSVCMVSARSSTRAPHGVYYLCSRLRLLNYASGFSCKLETKSPSHPHTCEHSN